MDGETRGTSASDDTRQRSRDLFSRLAAARSDHDRAACRDDLVHLHLPLVTHCAVRYRNRGEPLEDLVQVGTIGLLKAIDQFDDQRGAEFTTYATPTILGEIKRHFRDKGWAIRVPRRLQELRQQVDLATQDLTQDRGRSPTPRELAEAIGCDVEEVLEALESGRAYATLSLDSTVPDTGAGIVETLGETDDRLDRVELRASLRPVLSGLPPRERRILMLRFFKNMTQSQIAEEVGLSQMHVSRLLARTLDELRASLDGGA